MRKFHYLLTTDATNARGDVNFTVAGLDGPGIVRRGHPLGRSVPHWCAGRDVAIQSVANYRRLRRRGATVRKTTDMLIGTYCPMHDHQVLHDDRDFDVLARYLGLKTIRS